MRVFSLFLSLLVTCAAPQPSLPDESSLASLSPGGEASVTEVIDGDTVLLDDGREVRLVGIQAPKLPLGRPNFEKWPLADEAKAVLEELTLGRSVRLGYGGRRGDRHGRVLAHLVRDDGFWIQAGMLARGMARVYSFSDNRALIPRMLTIEREARRARRGIWNHPYYAVRGPDRLEGLIGTFQLVEARIKDVATVGGRVYMNFGADYRTDFTVTLAPAAAALFRSEGVEPSGYEGRVVRVRGWLESWNGPMIEATHPEQIEVMR